MATPYDDEQNYPPPPPQGPPGPPPPGGGGVDYNQGRSPYANPLGTLPDFDFPEGPGGRPHFNFGNAPAFKAPGYTQPTLADALKEPGYEFRLGQGESALQNSAAARGVLRTGATLEDILKYGQEFASSEYQNVYNRSVQNWQIANQRAQEAYAPRYGQYLNEFGAEQAAGLAGFEREWQQYLQQYDEFKFNVGLGYPQAPGGGGGGGYNGGYGL